MKIAGIDLRQNLDVCCQRFVFKASRGFLTNQPKLQAGFPCDARRVFVKVGAAVHAKRRRFLCRRVMIDGRLLA